MSVERPLALRCTVAIALLLATQALAQSPPAALPPDHPDLFHAFFQDAAAPNDAHLNASDQPKINSLVQSINSELNALDAQSRKYSDLVSARKQAPNPKVLNGYAASRRLLDMKGMRTLRMGLSNRGWQELQTYVNGPFRQKVNAAAGAH